MPVTVEYLLRILLAVGLGFVMGVERRLRLKVAGIRTHVVVAAGACLFMLVSKYGFPIRRSSTRRELPRRWFRA